MSMYDMVKHRILIIRCCISNPHVIQYAKSKHIHVKYYKCIVLTDHYVKIRTRILNSIDTLINGRSRESKYVLRSVWRYGVEWRIVPYRRVLTSDKIKVDLKGFSSSSLPPILYVYRNMCTYLCVYTCVYICVCVWINFHNHSDVQCFQNFPVSDSLLSVCPSARVINYSKKWTPKTDRGSLFPCLNLKSSACLRSHNKSLLFPIYDLHFPWICI